MGHDQSALLCFCPWYEQEGSGGEGGGLVGAGGEGEGGGGEGAGGGGEGGSLATVNASFIEEWAVQ